MPPLTASSLWSLCGWQGYSVSSLMRSAFRWGRYLWELEGPQQTQAFYSIYPSRLFHRAQVGTWIGKRDGSQGTVRPV